MWPKELSIHQVSIEFELKDADALDAGVQEQESYGFKLLHSAKTEHWGQIIARILTIGGVIVGLSYAPSLREKFCAGICLASAVLSELRLPELAAR